MAPHATKKINSMQETSLEKNPLQKNMLVDRFSEMTMAHPIMKDAINAPGRKTIQRKTVSILLRGKVFDHIDGDR